MITDRFKKWIEEASFYGIEHLEIYTKNFRCYAQMDVRRGLVDQAMLNLAKAGYIDSVIERMKEKP